MCKKYYVHPVFGTGIWTHDLRNTSLLPKPLDQGSHLNNAILLVKMCHMICDNQS